MKKIFLSNLWLKKVTLLFLLICSVGSAHSASKITLTEPKTVLVVGDSLSAEYGLKRGTGWVALLEQRLAEKKLNIRVINASISGDTTSGGLDRLPALLKKHHPTIVIIELGANDGLRGLPLAFSEKNLLSMISDTKGAGAKVLLIGMKIPPNYGIDYTDQFATMYKKIATKEKVKLVPFLLEGVADKPELFQADQLHLTAQAHPMILENIWSHLLPLIAK